MEKTKLDYLIEYLNALTSINNGDSGIPLWANTKAGEICDLIEAELRKL